MSIEGGENMRLDTWTIKKRMAEKTLTGARLAKETGLSPQSVSTILNRGTCSIINAGRIASVLGLELEEISKED